MIQLVNKGAFHEEYEVTALERGFPIVEVSQIAEQESWRKEINRPLYHIHKWWATRLGSVFRAITLAAVSPPATKVWDVFYDKHNLQGKVVLDPFMGSGTTLGEAVKLGVKAVGCDINPISTFLVRQALSYAEEGKLRAAFDRLEEDVAAEIRHYYQTCDPSTGERIPVLYWFWVKIVQTPDGDTVPLFDRYVFAQDAYAKKKPLAKIICPACWDIIADRYDLTTVECPHCRHSFNPQAGPVTGQYVVSRYGNRYKIKELLPKDGTAPAHKPYALLALRVDGQKLYLPIKPEDLVLFAEAEARLAQEDLPMPTLAVRPGHNTNQARGYNYLYWRDFFNARQLLCLGLLLRAILRIEDKLIQEQMLCLFSSTLEFNNLFCSYKGEGTGAVRPLFSNHILKPERKVLENSVWGTDKSSGTFCSLFESRLLRAKRYLDQPFELAFHNDLFGERSTPYKVTASDPIRPHLNSSWQQLADAEQGVLILNGDSSHLPLPDACVDAVVTDPPYFDFVHYSELSDFFFAWLAPVLKSRYAWFDKQDSFAAGEVQHKDPRIFAQQLSKVFSECHRVLKEDGVLAFSFHHSRTEGWAAIYEAVTTAGFAVVAAHPVHAELRASTPKNAAKEPISLDVVLVCRKRKKYVTYAFDEKAIFEQSAFLAEQLESAGMQISVADRFLIAASQILIPASFEIISYEAIKARLDSIYPNLNRDDVRYTSWGSFYKRTSFSYRPNENID